MPKKFMIVPGLIGVLSVIAGGMLAAFAAHSPTETAMWASAYLVLVAGVAQVAFAAALHYFTYRDGARAIVTGFVLYNIGNAAVLIGTVNKTQSTLGLVATDSGGALIMVAVLLFIYATRGSKRSWSLMVFYLVAFVIAVSVPIGLFLARR
jgi:hypothetical protein